jgi:hypothetical protein
MNRKDENTVRKAIGERLPKPLREPIFNIVRFAYNQGYVAGITKLRPMIDKELTINALVLNKTNTRDIFRLVEEAFMNHYGEKDAEKIIETFRLNHKDLDYLDLKLVVVKHFGLTRQ